MYLLNLVVFKNIAVGSLTALVIVWNSLKVIAKKILDGILRFNDEAGRETGILALTLTSNRNLHAVERVFWFIIIILSITGALLVTTFQTARYFTSPTVISFDRNFRLWTGALPAVTLCYYENAESFKATEYIQNTWNLSIIDKEYLYFMEFLYATINATTSNYADLARFGADERFDKINLYKLIREIERPFEQIITSFDANFSVQVIPVMTERGACYAINSPIASILNGENVRFETLRKPLTCQFGKEQCYVKMDLYDKTGTIDVHSPYEIAATDSSLIALRQSDEISASYKVMETVYVFAITEVFLHPAYQKLSFSASKKLRELSIDQRKCAFYDEETSGLPVYSKSLCLSKCRALMALEMCNCVPFFYQFVVGPSCNPAGFECLLDFKWPIWALDICNCPSTCAEINFSVQTIKKSSWGTKSNDDGSQSESATSSIRWDLIPPKVRTQRDVVFSFEDLLVSFGGALALFLGFSLLTMTQILYVITLLTLENLYNFGRISIGLMKKFSFILPNWRNNHGSRLLKVKPVHLMSTN